MSYPSGRQSLVGEPMPAEAGMIEYEMGYGADEFGNVLQGQFSGEKSSYQCELLATHHWCISQFNSKFQVEIRVQEMPPRKLGLFVLPVLKVQFHLSNSDAESKTHFFHRFHQYFHKGGG
jgi:hypothetical protein